MCQQLSEALLNAPQLRFKSEVCRSDFSLDDRRHQRRLALRVEVVRREMDGMERLDDEEKAFRRFKLDLIGGALGDGDVMPLFEGQFSKLGNQDARAFLDE